MAHLEYGNLDAPQEKAVLAHIHAVRGARWTEIWKTMIHHPPLTRALSDVGQVLRFEGTLPATHREAIINYTAHAMRSHYEWLCHTEVGRQVGLSEEIIRLIEKKSPPSAFPAPYRDLIEATQAAIEKKSLPQPLQNKLVEQYGKNGLVEIVVLCGYYQMLSSFLNAFDVKAESQHSL